MSQAPIREFADRSVDPNVIGFLHAPENRNGSGLVLTHGAGGNAQAPLLRAIAEIFAEAGFMVLRCNLPYRQSRSFGPPGPADAAWDRAGLKNALGALQRSMVSREAIQATPAKLYLGGHSYGGRQSSMLCAELSKEEANLVAGLLLLSYPLHPPRRPEQQRTQHLPDLHTPTLFVSGSRDPFGTIDELERALKMIPAKTKLLTVEGAGHDLGFKGKGTSSALPANILKNLESLVQE